MPEIHQPSSARTAFFASLATSAFFFVAFAAAMTAVPLAGPYCTGACRSYPYIDTLDLFPHDYIWIPLAMLALLAWLFLTLVLEVASGPEHRLAARTALGLALLSTGALLPTYAIQLSAIPPSLAAGETDGLAVFTMYNGHGIFIALEELGYGLMSLSMLALALALEPGSRLVAAARWLFALGFVAPLLAFVAYLAIYGAAREYRFEVFVIGVDWTVLIIAAALLALHFRRA